MESALIPPTTAAISIQMPGQKIIGFKGGLWVQSSRNMVLYSIYLAEMT